MSTAKIAPIAIAETATPSFEFAPTALPLAGQVRIAELPALPTAISAGAPVIALAAATIDPAASESDSLIDVAIPSQFIPEAEANASQSTKNEPTIPVAPIAKTMSGTGKVTIQMQIGGATPILETQQRASQESNGSPDKQSLAAESVVAANPVVIAVGNDAQLSANFRLSDAPIDPTGVVVPSKRTGQDSSRRRTSDAAVGEVAAPPKTKVSESPDKIMSQGLLLSSSSDKRLSMRIGAAHTTEYPSVESAKLQSNADQNARKSISDRSPKLNSENRLDPVVKAVQPAKHTTESNQARPSEHERFNALIAGKPDSDRLDQVDIQLRNFKSLELDGGIVEFMVEDEAVCRVMKTGNSSLSAIGVKDGTTRLAVIQESAGDRLLRVFAIRVTSADESVATVAQLAQELTSSLRSLYATSKIEVIADRGELSVRGVASSEEEAKAILSFVRRSTLRPVTDRVVTRR